MFFIPIALVIASPVVIHIANRIFVEELIPRKKLKKASTANREGNNQDDIPLPLGLDLAITPNEWKKIDELGAGPILMEARKRHLQLMETDCATVDVCKHCRRLDS